MKQLRDALNSLLEIDSSALEKLLEGDFEASYKKKEFLSQPDKVCEEVFFITKGLVRVYLTGQDGTEYNCFFAMENTFISDYSSFLTDQPAQYSIQAIEDTEVIVMPRAHIHEEYERSKEANVIGRKIAEHYFVLFDSRIKDIYLKTPKERYDELNNIFPGLHQRVPQHMVASFLNISAVHLSRLRAER